MKKRKKYVYVNTPIEKIKIEKFWKKKKYKTRKATEMFLFHSEIKLTDIQRKFDVYMYHFYVHKNRLLQLGLIYVV